MMTLTPQEAANLFRLPPDRFIDVQAGEVAYRRVGTGPDVLFVHGWPVSGATFRTLLPHLVDKVTCHVIDFPGAGSSRFTASTPITVAQHIRTVVKVIDQLGLDDLMVVGHNAGGLIARHAIAGDPRVRALGLIDTEQPQGLTWRFRLFLAARSLPGFSSAFGWILGRPRLRRNPLVLGSTFEDSALIDGEFNEFFLRPLHEDAARRAAAVTLLRSFDTKLIRDLGAVHQQLAMPVQLIWGEHDAFFPLRWAREMVDGFQDAQLTVIERAGLFSHEEQPSEVAAGLLALLDRSG